LDNKTLGAGADQAFATDSTTAADDTFNVSDAVDGGAGDDTFFLTVDSIGAGVIYVPSRITNFETLSITNIDAADAFTTNVSLMAPTAIAVSASSSGVNVTNVTAGSEITLTGNTAAVDIQHKNAGLTGTSDSVSVNLIGNTGGVTIDSDGAQDIESATITATGVNSGSLVIGDSAGSTITSLTVGGTGSLAITAGELATLTSLDASGNSGGVSYTTQVTAETVTLTGGAGNDTLTGNTGDDVITGGAGADTLSMGAAGGDDHVDGGAGNDTITVAGVTKDDTISGGEGTDTLKINAALAYSAALGTNDAAGVSGFETLYVDTTLSQDMTPLTGITTLMAGASDVATLTKVSGITTVALLGAGAGADLTLATDGAADSLVVALGLDSLQTNTSSSSLDIVKYEKLTVSSAGADGNATTAKADSLTDLTVVGSKNVTINLNPDTGSTTLALKTIDASGATGTVNVQAASADAGVTVTPGSDALTVNLGDGADTVTGTAKADNLTTGKGNDTIVGNGGNDTVDAGAGDDTVTLGDGNNDVTLGTGADTLTAGNGNNTVTNTSGNSTVTLGNGVNGVTNTAGNMTLVTGSAIDTITNTAGNADITSGAGNDVITNTAGNSTIDAGAGNDSITLTAGNSNVDAGAGNDTIALGSGKDTVDGGAGTDSATFSHGAGVFDSTISNVETVTGTMTASGTVDMDSIAGATTLKITANDTVASLTVRDVATGTTLNVSDDLAEDASNGDIQNVTIDSADEASLTLKVLGNQEAALVAAADIEDVVITDVDAFTLTVDGGPNADQAITHDVESLTLDATDTTSVVINTVANGGIDIGELDGVDAVDSISITTAAAGSFAMVSAVEVDALSSLSLVAVGSGGNITAHNIGSAAGAILNTLVVSASSGAAIDAFESDLETTVDMVSASITADGAGSSVTMEGDIVANSADITTLTFAASNGGTIEGNDAETFDFAEIGTWTMETSDTGSSFTMEGIATGNADIENIVIDAQGAASTIDIGAGEFEADIDSLAITAGSYATLNAVGGLAFEDEVGMESFSFNVAANGIVDTTSAGSEANDGIIVQSASWASMEIGIGASATIEEDMLTLVSTGEEGLITDLDLDIAGGTSAVIVDLNAVDPTDDAELDAADIVTIATVPVILGRDDEADAEGDGDGALGWDEGAIDITGSGAHTVDLGEAAEGFTVNTGSGADTITTGDGNDVINSGAGGDLINITATGDSSITGGSGADDFDFAGEATTWGTTTITDFLQGVDDLSINDIGTDIDNAENAVATARAQAAIGNNDIEIVALNASTTSMLATGGTETIADFEDLTDVAAYLDEGYSSSAGDEAGIVLNNGTNSYFYLYLDGGDTGFEADEIQLVAVVSNVVLTATDIS
jgi:Ca2+-binding RTX toxin-like protein